MSGELAGDGKPLDHKSWSFRVAGALAANAKFDSVADMGAGLGATKEGEMAPNVQYNSKKFSTCLLIGSKFH